MRCGCLALVAASADRSGMSTSTRSALDARGPLGTDHPGSLQTFALALGIGMDGALGGSMGLRTFLASDGRQWTVWLIRSGSVGRVPGTPTEWLAFQNEDGTERRRLLAVPPKWAELSDDRLELLRRVAEPVALLTQRHTLPGGISRQSAPENDADS